MQGAFSSVAVVGLALVMAAPCHAFVLPRPISISSVSRISSSSSSSVRMAADEDADDAFGETDWDEAMKKLNARQQDVDASMPPLEDDSSSSAGPSFRFAPPPDAPTADNEGSSSADGGGGFRFENRESLRDETVAGLDKRDEALLRNATLYGGRALTIITISSLVFYIYVGISGGITDGFDRFPDAVNMESLAETIAREGADAF